MTSNLTVHEIYVAKNKMQKQIADILKGFENAYGFESTDISMSRGSEGIKDQDIIYDKNNYYVTVQVKPSKKLEKKMDECDPADVDEMKKRT